MPKIALYDILVQGEGVLNSEEILAGQPIPAKHKDKVAGWDARGLLTDSGDSEQKDLEAAQAAKEKADEAALEAAQKEAAAKAAADEAAAKAAEDALKPQEAAKKTPARK